MAVIASRDSFVMPTTTSQWDNEGYWSRSASFLLSEESSPSVAEDEEEFPEEAEEASVVRRANCLEKCLISLPSRVRISCLVSSGNRGKT